MTILILAAGEGIRFDAPYPKQLAPLNGDTVLGRIVRQARLYGSPTIVSHHTAILDAFPYTSHYRPSQRKYITQTLLNTYTIWAGKVIVLLGDVIYSAHGMHQIMARGGITFFSDKDAGEIVALVFERKHYSYMLDGLNFCIKVAEEDDMECAGKLWGLYRWHTGIPLDKHMYKVGEPALQRIRDWTTDIDNVREYEDFMKHVVGAGKLDDVGERVGG